MNPEEDVHVAVVKRLCCLLERPDQKFDVTSTHATFGALICWIVQSIEDQDHTNERKLSELKNTLNQHQLADLVDSWGISRRFFEWDNENFTNGRNIPFRSLKGRPHCVYIFLKKLRDAFAHSDGNRTIPCDVSTEDFKGYRYTFTKKNELGEYEYSFLLELDKSQMQNIGIFLAELYEMEWNSKYPPSKSKNITRALTQRD